MTEEIKGLIKKANELGEPVTVDEVRQAEKALPDTEIENRLREMIRWRLERKVDDLYAECLPNGYLERYFDTDSEAMLEKKAEVLERLVKGETPEEIGQPFFEILELMPKGDAALNP